MNTTKLWILAAMFISLFLVVACGGNGQPDPDDTDGDVSEVTDGDTTDTDDDTTEASEDNVPSWTDPTTGLRWGLDQKEFGYNHDAAVDYCQKMGANWRLPTISELRSIVRGCAATATGGPCKVTDECLDLHSCWDGVICQECPSLEENSSYQPQELGESRGMLWSSSPNADWAGPSFWFLEFSSARVSCDGPEYDDFGVICVNGP